MNRKLISLVLLCATVLCAHAQQTHEKAVREIQYLLYLPENYSQDTVKRFPLMLFLHGSGERGTDLNKVKVNGPPKMIESGKKFPFIVVSPQADEFGWDESQLYHMLLSIKKKFRVDNQRIYLTGLSMGGYGTWKFAMKHPEEFAAIAPICGGGDTTDALNLRYMPVWAFHGLKDDVVLPQQSIDMVNAVKKYNPSAKLTLYPEANHNSWDTTYTNDALYTWMLQHTKFAYKQVAVKQNILNGYEGKYVNGKDTIQVLAEKGCLIVRPRRDHSVELKAASDKLFFVEENMPVDLEFVRKGNEEHFVLTQGKQTIFRKVGK